MVGFLDVDSTRRRTFASVALAVVASAVVAVVELRPAPADTAYVGSERCLSCHRQEHRDWHASLHPKMMRRVGQSGVALPDLSDGNPALQFHPDEAVWAIGSKWEQQFMGQDEAGETLLPGAWSVHKAQWQEVAWDGWQVPVPRKRCHGCHTVGLDAETGKFVEAGIGCESCHGPGEWHSRTKGHGKIASPLDSDVCGQCHSRGQSPSGGTFFPTGYRPGGKLGEHFREWLPSPGQNSSAWWGNGSERKRHQEFTAWRQGGHADSLRSLKENYDGRFGAITGECLECHSAEGALNKRGGMVALPHTRNGVTCVVCHNVHGSLEKVRLGCDGCHRGGAFYHRPELNAGHVPCPPSAEVACVSCHMPLTAKVGGAFRLHSHRPGIVPPIDTKRFGVPNSCANGGCHKTRDPDWVEAAFARSYPMSPHVMSGSENESRR